ncbi:hypothetical protein PR048_002576 [Dryococelus australis]|uniref:Uncharacterized protein n=1 Tax=Dryococelus australis TaxID=614101 RepID=A0ABQ9IKI4_9NEOP|nr:hypothetical protein PR048_002576 [Dryococelus australis]
MVHAESYGFEECDQENIQDWLECDVDDPGYQVLTDDEIIASVIDDQDPCSDEEESSSNHTGKAPSIEEAVHCLETAMKWRSYQVYLEKKKELNAAEEKQRRKKRKIEQQLRELEEKKKIMKLEREKEDIEMEREKKTSLENEKIIEDVSLILSS